MPGAAAGFAVAAGMAAKISSSTLRQMRSVAPIEMLLELFVALHIVRLQSCFLIFTDLDSDTVLVYSCRTCFYSRTVQTCTVVLVGDVEDWVSCCVSKTF